MAKTEKRSAPPKDKSSSKAGTRPEFTTLSAGQTGDGSPNKAYSNSGGGGGYQQVTSSIGNK